MKDIYYRKRNLVLTTDLMDTRRSEPLSIESLLQKQKDEKESASKVQFSIPFQQQISDSEFLKKTTAQIPNKGRTRQTCYS